MTHNNIHQPHGNAGFGKRQGVPPRRKVVGGSVDETEKAEIQSALEQSGFRNESEGVRVVMLAFARSTRVRDAVSQHARAA